MTLQIRANQLQPGDVVTINGEMHSVSSAVQDGPEVRVYTSYDCYRVPAQGRVTIHNA